MEYISLALKSPTIDDEKTMTLRIHDAVLGQVNVIRYGKHFVVERRGNCRVYDEDDIEGVLKIELKHVSCVGKTRCVTRGVRAADVKDIKSHLEKFDAGCETCRVARLLFRTKKGLTTDSLIVAFGGKKNVVEHRSEISIARDEHPMFMRTEFDDIETAMRCIQDHLAFCDDNPTMELGYETKLVEIKMLKTNTTT
jgi:hypothetical protein